VAWFVDEPVDPADPLAAVKHRAAAIIAAQEETDAAARKGHTAARADRLAGVGELMTDVAFTAGEVTEIMDRSGLSDDDLDAAAYVAIVLRETELGHGG
jgi:hypothetical protein